MKKFLICLIGFLCLIGCSSSSQQMSGSVSKPFVISVMPVSDQETKSPVLNRQEFSTDLIDTAIKTNKFLIMYIHNNEICFYCKEMEKTLSDKSVIKYLNSNYVFADLDLTKEKNMFLFEELAKILKSTSIPNTVVIKPSADKKDWPMVEVTGYFEPLEYITLLVYAKNIINEEPKKDMPKKKD